MVDRDPQPGDTFVYSDHDIVYTVTRVQLDTEDVFYSDPTLDPVKGDRQARLHYWRDRAALIDG